MIKWGLESECVLIEVMHKITDHDLFQEIRLEIEKQMNLLVYTDQFLMSTLGLWCWKL